MLVLGLLVVRLRCLPIQRARLGRLRHPAPVAHGLHQPQPADDDLHKKAIPQVVLFARTPCHFESNNLAAVAAAAVTAAVGGAVAEDVVAVAVAAAGNDGGGGDAEGTAHRSALRIRQFLGERGGAQRRMACAHVTGGGGDGGVHGDARQGEAGYPHQQESPVGPVPQAVSLSLAKRVALGSGLGQTETPILAARRLHPLLPSQNLACARPVHVQLLPGYAHHPVQIHRSAFAGA